MNTLTNEPVQLVLLRWYDAWKRSRADEPSMLDVAEAMYQHAVRDTIKVSAQLADAAPTMRKFLDLIDEPLGGTRG